MDWSRLRTSCAPTFYVRHLLFRVFLEILGVGTSPSVADPVVEIALWGVAAAPDVAGPVVDVAAVAAVEPAVAVSVAPASVSEAAEPAVSVALVSVVDAA
jgi:hypothetical protein